MAISDCLPHDKPGGCFIWRQAATTSSLLRHHKLIACHSGAALVESEAIPQPLRLDVITAKRKGRGLDDMKRAKVYFNADLHRALC